MKYMIIRCGSRLGPLKWGNYHFNSHWLVSAYGVETKSEMHRTQRVHVGIWYILRAQRGSYIPTLRPKYIPYTYVDPLGELQRNRVMGLSGLRFPPFLAMQPLKCPDCLCL